MEGGETARLRRILLTYSNQQEQSQQRLSLLETELARSVQHHTHLGQLPSLPPSCSVEEEHGLVKRELERQPRQADMEARVAELQRHLEDLRDEIRKVGRLHTLTLSYNGSHHTQRSKDTQHYTTEIASRDQRLTAILEEIVSSLSLSWLCVLIMYQIVAGGAEVHRGSSPGGIVITYLMHHVCCFKWCRMNSFRFALLQGTYLVK